MKRQKPLRELTGFKTDGEMLHDALEFYRKAIDAVRLGKRIVALDTKHGHYEYLEPLGITSVRNRYLKTHRPKRRSCFSCHSMVS